MKHLFSLLLLTLFPALYAGTGEWTSTTLSSKISYTTLSPTNALKDRNGKYMTIVYLENLGFKKISQHSNDEDVQAMLDEGYRVIRLDYQGNAKAVSPGINQDIISINDQLNKGSMCGFSSISPIRSYILMEGYRIRRDVSYYLDDPTIYNWPGSPYTESQGDSLYMDIIYPTSPTTPVPVLLSFSYSNSYATLSGGKLTDEHYHQRLYLGYTLSMFDDSVLEGAPAHGIAWAIADHPKYCDWGQGKPQGGNNKDYGSIETNPDATQGEVCRAHPSHGRRIPGPQWRNRHLRLLSWSHRRLFGHRQSRCSRIPGCLPWALSRCQRPRAGCHPRSRGFRLHAPSTGPQRIQARHRRLG